MLFVEGLDARMVDDLVEALVGMGCVFIIVVVCVVMVIVITGSASVFGGAGMRVRVGMRMSHWFL